jgi:DNA polymerase-1
MAAPLLAVDLPSMLYRAFFALPDSIKGADGKPVNALLGSANLILQEVTEHEPRAVVLCLGPDAAAYRVDLYPAYHAERPEMPDGLAGQWADAPAFFRAFGWTVADHDSLEADDLLGSFARVESSAGGMALLLTGDRDMFQCASERVTVLYVSTGVRGAQRVTPDEVERRYGVAPELVPDFIALRGDPSDGLPGAKGVADRDVDSPRRADRRPAHRARLHLGDLRGSGRLVPRLVLPAPGGQLGWRRRRARSHRRWAAGVGRSRLRYGSHGLALSLDLGAATLRLR